VRPAHDVIAQAGSEEMPYSWYNQKEVTDEILEHAEALNLEQIPAEREFVESHSFRFRADVGRHLFVQVEKNLRSFGGYLSPRTERFIVRVPPFPPQLKILSQGSLLALSGDTRWSRWCAICRECGSTSRACCRRSCNTWYRQSNGDFANPSFYGGLRSRQPDRALRPQDTTRSLGARAGPFRDHRSWRVLEERGSRKGAAFILLTVQGYDPRVEAAQRRAAAARRNQAPSTERREPSTHRERGAAEEQPGEQPDESARTSPTTAPAAWSTSDWCW